VLLPACLDPSRPPLPALRVDAGASDAHVAPLRFETPTATDARGRPRALDALPRVFEVHVPLSNAAPDVALDLRDGVLLVRGELDADLASDLAATPLRATTRARLVPAKVGVREGVVTIAPIDPQPPGEALLLVLAPWIRGPNGRPVLSEARVHALRVSRHPADGAAAAETWPADGTPAVPMGLAFAAVRFDGVVYGGRDGVFLAGPDGAPLGAAVTEPPCETLGWSPGHCIVLTPWRPLAPGAEHALVVGDGLRDGTGAVLPRRRTTFWTGTSLQPAAPRPSALPCAVDETETPLGCALVDDDRVVLRIRLSEPALVWLRAGESLRRAVAPRGEAELMVTGLGPDREVELRLTATDLAGLPHLHTAAVHTTPPLPRVSIVEVRADPRGPEPRQEYVELLNYGDVDIDLTGFSLSDRADAVGDVFAAPATVRPGARVLVVADAFDPSSSLDDPVPAGVPLIRIGHSLGSGGLANGGEALFLRDREGRRVSAAPALRPAREGACIVRIGDDPRTGEAGAFGHEAAGGCTPGAQDRLPALERRTS
jgi:hypothetical protein